jgi:predicted acylesterase/phospholipase RssA
MTSVSEIPNVQRVLILQGGGALGAYEAGAIKALIEEIPMLDVKRGISNQPLFDIIAGTSIGAINATILVSWLKEHKNDWKGAAHKLEEFWSLISYDTHNYIDSAIHWWKSDHSSDENAATVEAARRYYSAKYFLKHGTPNVFSKPEFIEDNKFFDFSTSLPNNQWYFYDNVKLRETVINRGFANFPISTTGNEPRLLIVSTDLADGAAVTFDSYSKLSEYGRVDKNTGKYRERKITYSKGIELSHVMASSCIPLFYKYEEIQGRKFWDGGVLSNTPLREVLHMHRNYWLNTVGEGKPESKVPNLEVYIIGVWPSSGSGNDDSEEIPSDFDGLKVKLYDIHLSDKTEYDEKSAIMVSDLIDIVEKIRSLAPKYMTPEKVEDFEEYLRDYLTEQMAQSKGRDGEQRSYGSLLNGRFKLDRVVRIELREDQDDISNKAFDLSKITINHLISRGEFDTRNIFKNLK